MTDTIDLLNHETNLNLGDVFIQLFNTPELFKAQFDEDVANGHLSNDLATRIFDKSIKKGRSIYSYKSSIGNAIVIGAFCAIDHKTPFIQHTLRWIIDSVDIFIDYLLDKMDVPFEVGYDRHWLVYIAEAVFEHLARLTITSNNGLYKLPPHANSIPTVYQTGVYAFLSRTATPFTMEELAVTTTSSSKITTFFDDSSAWGVHISESTTKASIICVRYPHENAYTHDELLEIFITLYHESLHAVQQQLKYFEEGAFGMVTYIDWKILTRFITRGLMLDLVNRIQPLDIPSTPPDIATI